MKACARPPGDVPLVDIRFRNGEVERGVKPASWRWGVSPKFPVDWEYDIVAWQRPAEAS